MASNWTCRRPPTARWPFCTTSTWTVRPPGPALLRTFTLAQLAGIDAGVRFDDSFEGTPIPTLDQVFDLVGDRCVVNVEIKNMDWNGGREAEPLARMIQQRKLYDQVIVSSFNPIALRKNAAIGPLNRLGAALLYQASGPDRGDGKTSSRGSRRVPLKFLLLHLSRAWLSPRIAAEALHPHFASIDAQLVAKALSRGQLVNAWTVNSGAEARRLAHLGVNAIITDLPDKIRQSLSKAAPSTDSPAT